MALLLPAAPSLHRRARSTMRVAGSRTSKCCFSLQATVRCAPSEGRRLLPGASVAPSRTSVVRRAPGDDGQCPGVAGCCQQMRNGLRHNPAYASIRPQASNAQAGAGAVGAATAPVTPRKKHAGSRSLDPGHNRCATHRTQSTRTAYLCNQTCSHMYDTFPGSAAPPPRQPRLTCPAAPRRSATPHTKPPHAYAAPSHAPMHALHAAGNWTRQYWPPAARWA